MIIASVMFAASNALAKYLVESYPVGEVMFFRSSSAFLLCCALVLPMTGFSVFWTSRRRDHIVRGLSQSVSQTFTVLALSLMPLAGVLAIGFSAPLWAALLSVVWLREPAGVVRWTVLLVGFLGVLVVTDPGADSLQVGALFALANAVMYGTVTVAVRGMSKTESANTLLMWQMMTMTLFHSCLLPFGFVWPSGVDAAMLFILGGANAGAQYFWTKALSLAPTAAVSPFYYLILVWGVAIGFGVWGEVPTVALVLGSVLVIASGLILIWNETILKKSAGTSASGTLVRITRVRNFLGARRRPRLQLASACSRQSRSQGSVRLAQGD